LLFLFCSLTPTHRCSTGFGAMCAHLNWRVRSRACCLSWASCRWPMGVS
jgi:hypothetical protein